MWIASPASPNSAAASGMPICTALPNDRRDRAHARRPRRRRAMRAAWAVDERTSASVGTKKASTTRPSTLEVDAAPWCEKQRGNEDVERRGREDARRFARREPAASRRRPADRDDGEDREQLDGHGGDMGIGGTFAAPEPRRSMPQRNCRSRRPRAARRRSRANGARGPVRRHPKRTPRALRRAARRCC